MKAVHSISMHRHLMAQTKFTKLPKYGGVGNQTRSVISLFFDSNQLADSFRLYSDSRDAKKQNKVKPIHAEGISGIVEWNAVHGHGYSGIFDTGGVGIVRFSTALPYSKGGDFIPGLALKIFVDDSPSVNFHAMVSLDGQGDDPFFFRNAFRTSIDEPSSFLTKQLARVFHSALSLVSPWSHERPVNERTIPLIEASSVTSEGTVVFGPTAPHSIKFLPAVRQEVDWDSREDFRDSLQRFVHPGMKLFDIVDQDDTPLGDLTLLEPLIASQHGDDMFFRHQRVSA